ncbi:heparinase II/III family protein [Spirosoma validum]|uniref:Heparinase II/III family protein n=1 Tax=Spirosoma validum TaxID=2771355 RepID=A0A927B2G0_9BACT|nr:heparinase II/III family protein [Spirosoma validum]MBD2754370.1 heparinase II/III family protein [Spirosoma validum]
MEAIATSNLFLTVAEKKAILSSHDPVMMKFRQALRARVIERLSTLGVQVENPALGWWYPCAEHLADAAMQYALEPTDALATWLRNTTLDIVRLPTSDWVGPWFRDHAEPFTGHLETAHVCWGISAVLSLAGDVFTDEEGVEVREYLYKKGVVLCRRWLLKNSHLGNWRGIMASGAVVASAALGDEALVAEFTPEVARMAQAFQPDGSYGESLQYGNYLANALMLAYESLIRQYPDQARQLDISAYGRGMAWMAQSMLYRKPMGNSWGQEPRARAVNFNDSAALFRPSGDLLLHVAARYDDSIQAGLARWLFQEYYEPVPTQGPHDLATFGMLNDWGFLTLPLLTRACKPISPEAATLPLTVAFSNGNTFVRDGWDGKSILAIQGGNNDGVYAPGHLQGDLNSFMLAYNQERLLVDPGHSCYRNLIHGLESATQTHNTCTFLIEQDMLGLQEDLAKIKLLEQKNVLSRRLIHADGTMGSPVERGGRLEAVQRVDEISLVVSEVGHSYGYPIQEFARCWIHIGAHVTLVIDRIQASEPVRTVWNWLINNRDGKSISQIQGNTLTIRRHQAGLKLWHFGEAALAGPVYAYLHDAYHPEPDQPGEGRPGSGLLFRHTDAKNSMTISRLHLIVADDVVHIDDWKATHKEQALAISKPGINIQLTGTYDDKLSIKLETGGITYLITDCNLTTKS